MITVPHLIIILFLCQQYLLFKFIGQESADRVTVQSVTLRGYRVTPQGMEMRNITHEMVSKNTPTCMELSPGYTGMGLSPGYTGVGLSPSYTGVGPSPGYTGMGLSPGYTGMGLSPGYTGMGLSPTCICVMLSHI